MSLFSVQLLAGHYLPDSANLDLQSSESLLDEMCGEIDRLRSALVAWEMKYPSEEEVEVIKAHMKDEGVVREPAQYIKIKGSGTDVPLYLRWGKLGQKIRNKNISKRETELFIKEVWSMKLNTPDEAGGEEYKRMSLEDFLYVFLKKKYGFQEAIVQYAYSYLDSLDRFRFDGDCELFLSILQKKVSECVYVDQHQMLAGLKATFERADSEYHRGKTKGRLPRRVILDNLREFFANKSEANIKKMNHALFLNDKNEFINYRALFEEDREGNQGSFAECIRDQHLEEIYDYTEELRRKLHDKADRYGGRLNLAQIREIIQVSDPTKPTKEVEAYLREGCDLLKAPSGTPLPSDSDASIDPDEFFKNLSRRLLKRTGPPPGEKQKAELGRRASLVFGGPTSALLKPTVTFAESIAPGTASSGTDDESTASPTTSANNSPVKMIPPSMMRSVKQSPSVTPSESQASLAAPVPRKPIFSELARRISMPRTSALSNIVLAAAMAAKDAAAAAAATTTSPISNTNTVPSTPSSQSVVPAPAADVGSIPSSTLSSPSRRPDHRRSSSVSLLSIANSTSFSHRSDGSSSSSPSRVTSFARANSLDRLQHRLQLRDADESARRAQESYEEQVEASKNAVILTLKREASENDELTNGAEELDDGDSSHYDLYSPVHVTPNTTTNSAPSSKPLNSVAMNVKLPPSSLTISPSSDKSPASVTSSISKGVTPSASVVSSPDVGFATNPSTPSFTHLAQPANSPTFSPITTSVINTRKKIRQSLRRSGGLASMLVEMAKEEAD